MNRIGNWVQTMPFSLNASKFTSESNTVSTQVVLPFTESVAVLSQWKTLGADPSGSRHLTTHPSFTRVLASGAGSQVASLDFDSFDLQATDISIGSGVSRTKVMLFRIDKFTSPGITRVHNMKLWASDLSDFLEPQTHRLLYRVSTPWPSGFVFSAGDMGNTDYWMPNSLPERQNLFRTGRTEDKDVFGAGFTNIVGSGDSDVSQWISIALAASGTMPLGEYGDLKDGPEGFSIRVTYNIDNLGERFGD